MEEKKSGKSRFVPTQAQESQSKTARCKAGRLFWSSLGERAGKPQEVVWNFARVSLIFHQEEAYEERGKSEAKEKRRLGRR